MKRILLFITALVFVQMAVADNISLPYKAYVTNSKGVSDRLVNNYYGDDNRLIQAVERNVNDNNALYKAFNHKYNENGDLESSTTYNYGAGGFKKHEMSKYTYSDGHRSMMETFTYDFNTSKETLILKVLYTYDDGGKLIKEETHSAFAPSYILKWQNDIEYKDFNAQGKPLYSEKISIPYGKTEKTVTEKATYTYDDNGNIKTYMLRKLQSEVFIDDTKREYSYNANNKIEKMIAYGYAWIADQPLEETDYVYDDSGMLLSETRQTRNWSTLVLEFTAKSEYSNATNYSSDNVPLNVTSEYIVGDGAKLKWDAPVNTTGLIGYDVYINGVKHGETVSKDLLETTVKGLVMGNYFAFVQAKYDEIGANVSDIFDITVTDDKCMPPTGLRLDGELVFDEENESTPVNLLWDAPETSYTPLGYNLYCNNTKVNTELITTTSFKDIKLSSNRYVYTVVASYEVGMSPQSAPLTIDLTTKFRVDLTSSTPWGTLEGNGYHYDKSSVTIKATPNKGFTFLKWTETLLDGGSYQDVSTDPSYTFTITRKSVFTATFKKIAYPIPTGLTLVETPIFNESTENTPVKISWIAPTTTYVLTGYNVFVGDTKLNDNPIDVTTFTHNVAASGTYIYTVVAIYEDGVSAKSEALSVEIKTKYKVTLTSENVQHGRVEGTGYYEDGSSVTVRAIANEGYTIKKWIEGDTEVSNSAEYTFTLTAPRVLTAQFAVVDGVEDIFTESVKLYSVSKTIVVEAVPTSKIEIIDIAGRTIRIVTSSDGSESIAVDNSGIYVVRVSCGNSVISKKLIVK